MASGGELEKRVEHQAGEYLAPKRGAGSFEPEVICYSRSQRVPGLSATRELSRRDERMPRECV
jgi:hypothetical protein